MIRSILFVFAFLLVAGTVRGKDERSIKHLRDALVALAPDVDPAEAELCSVTAHTASRSLAREYRIAWCPAFQNLLIHMGKRERGYCGHYARDIGSRLKELKLKTLVLHWGEAYPNTTSENNALVVTARNQRFEDGIIVDGWRRAGRLLWCHVKEDHEYEVEQHYGHSGITMWRENMKWSAWLQEYQQESEQKPNTASPSSVTR